MTSNSEQPLESAALTGTSPPLYQMVVGELRSEILQGLYPIGTALPSELALVSRFNVSRHTVREALRHLKDLGLVESHQGKGTLVLQPGGPQVYVHQVNSIADLHDYNVESRYDNQAKTIKLDGITAGRLGVEKGETWLKIGGTRYEPGKKDPICAVEIFVPGRFAGIGRLLGRRTGPIYGLVEDVYGESIGEVDQTLRAAPLRPDLAAILKVDEGETAVEIKRIYRLLDGSPAEITFNYYKAANFNFSMKLRRVRNGG
ncbi:GntR family transcriptional regulator [Sphingobium sp. EP60837]|uniref:GntR family transcriptional regulator n=1 Tax=Sphingobium sp. EP60837 TaxID=1855519 RepID=UPI0007DCC189|nr:GntR family transcriptional regulator [Sphingobium sp. EP60837]ANI80214.1 HTH-type transcriptional repressor YvoA [Sphingobium sp. EP60837]